jgi:16S rRNA (guanine527-N7)-methyltransferase
MPNRLNQLLEQAGASPLPPEQSASFSAYLELLQKWNARTNLTAIRDEEGILSRHFLESILCARALPAGLSTLLDLGSGAGFPGLPIAILRPTIAVTLAESQHKKAAFLREAIRTLNLSNVQVHAARAEALPTRYACVTLRAVDKMTAVLPIAIHLLQPGGYLALLTTTTDAPTLQQLAGPSFTWQPAIPLPAKTTRILFLGQHQITV